jgi:hypothetical protein
VRGTIQGMAQPKPRPAASVWEIPRNDVAACVAFYRARGQVTPDEMSVMLRLQDDDAELMRTAADWKSSEA